MPEIFSGFYFRQRLYPLFTMDEIRSGDIIDEKENLLSRHKGIIHYTVGQRKGFVSLLKELNNKQGLTVVLVTYNPALTGIAGRVIRVKGSRVLIRLN